jgi:hypothetical protein
MKVGDRARFFDPLSKWRETGDVGDNDQYFLPATVVFVQELRGLEVVDIKFDHRPDDISRGHFTTITRPLTSTMKFVRVVLAVDNKDIERFKAYLDCFIEADKIPLEFESIHDSTYNPIQGAYVSNVYGEREDALHGPWLEQEYKTQHD